MGYQLSEVKKDNMPGGTFGSSELPPCGCKHHDYNFNTMVKSVLLKQDNNGQQCHFRHPYNNAISRSIDRKPQVTYPTLGGRTFGKPFLGMNSYTSPYFQSRNGFHTIHSENSPVKPRIVTVVKPGSHPLKKITLLLNRRSVQTFEQLVADISEALGFPRWKNDRVRKLYNLKGKEIRSISDFFRGDDAFIAMGREQLTLKSIEIVFNELYPDRPLKHYEKVKYKMNDKINVDSSYEDIDIVNHYVDEISPRLSNKPNGKTHTKNRIDETRRPKKSDSETCKADQEKTFGLIKKVDQCKNKHLHCKLSNTSVNYIISSEHCRENKQKHQMNSGIENEILFEGINKNEFPKHHLEKDVKSKSKKTLKKISQEDDSKLICHVCNNKMNTSVCSEETKREDILEKCKSPGWQNSRGKNKNEEVYSNNHLKSQCSPERKENNGEIVSSTTNKSTSRLIVDVLEQSKSNVTCVEEKKIVVENGCSYKTGVICGSATLKTEGGSSEKVETKESDIFNVKRPCCIKNRIDIETYYEIGRIIGDGNFAVVKECKLRNVNQEFAMKIIDKAKLKGKEDIIENEVKIIKSLSHPNIVRLLDDYETDTDIYLILEYIKGGDLFDAITESIKFTEHDAALMLTDLCEALVYIHSKNIVHRDLKPENLLVQNNPDGSRTLKLADFGLAIYVTEPIFIVCGTPTYVAPEILSERGYGLEVDMWATGVILYILLCGFPPFRSTERKQEELFKIIQHGQYEFISPYWDNISDEAKDLISRLLMLNPKKRYSAKCVLQHAWIQLSGQANILNLQREVTMNIERHFGNRRRKEDSKSQK
ncbi:serine/threonine-protein kinase DCLK3 [Discoglossus pictus]